jgi:hypothetical protein
VGFVDNCAHNNTSILETCEIECFKRKYQAAPEPASIRTEMLLVRLNVGPNVGFSFTCIVGSFTVVDGSKQWFFDRNLAAKVVLRF